MRQIPIIATSGLDNTDAASLQAFAVAKPAEQAVWIYWIDGGQLVDEVTIDIRTALATLLALSGALDVFELATQLASTGAPACPLISRRICDGYSACHK